MLYCSVSYPITSPSHSLHLPNSQWREWVTIPIAATEEFYCVQQLSREKFQELNRKNPNGKWEISKAQAIRYIRDSIQQVKKTVMGSLYPNKEKALAILDKQSVEFIQMVPNNMGSMDVIEFCGALFSMWARKVEAVESYQELVGEFVFAAEDFTRAGASEEEYVANGRRPVCYDYAFYCLQEEKAFPYMFASKPCQWPEQLFLHPVEFLSEWGYTRSTSMAPKRTDSK